MLEVKLGLLGAVLLAAGCSANSSAPDQGADIEGVLDDVRVTVQPVTPSFPDVAANRAFASCPEGEAYAPPQPIRLDAIPIELGTKEAASKALAPNVSYAGGWHLTSDEPNFGGLSGLDILEDGNLLAVSDAGAFVQIDLVSGVPNGASTISYMRGPDGTLLDGKRTSDAEGLHVEFGLAVVSFERDHRVAAFNLDACGAAARGVPVSAGSAIGADGGPAPSGLPEDLPENNGLEALTFSDGYFLTGIEAGDRTGTPLFRPTVFGGQFDPAGLLPTPRNFKLTGLDTVDEHTYALFRRYVPVFGNTIEVRRFSSLEHEGDRLFRLDRSVSVDNFEGIAATKLEDGTVRLFIISDDNFSAQQRSLLMAFDVSETDTAK